MNTASPAHAPLRITHGGGGDALLRFRFGGDPSEPLNLPCRLLAGPAEECWYAGPIGESAETTGAAWAHGVDYAMAALSVDAGEGEAGIELAAERAYARLITCVRPSAHPYLLRIWNYFPAINAGEGDGERYRRFCVGRARGVDGRFNDPPPAATAIGASGDTGRLQVIALCARAPALALENPRQTPAWRYPREYGPVSPGFSRGALLDAASDAPRLLASGTASIVGHVSRHIGDAAAQLRESLDNLAALLDEGGARSGRRFAFADAEALRVYLRDPADLDGARAQVQAAGLPGERVSYLQGEVCRRELAVELEGVFAGH